MKKLIYLLFFLLLPLSLPAQTNVDSLVNVLNEQKLSTEEQLKLYEDICQHYYAAYDADETMKYAEKGLALSKKAKNTLKSAIFTEFIGYAYKDKKNFDSAYIYFEKALELAIKSRDIEQQTSVYIDLGSYYSDQKMWDLGLEQYLKALPLSENLEDKGKYLSILGNIGSTHCMLNNSDKAIFYFEKMKEVSEKANSIHHKRKAYYELGALYKNKTEYGKSSEYLHSALNISRETKSKIYETMCLQALAQLYSHDEVQDFNQALLYAEESLILSKEMANPTYLSVSLTTLSIIYNRQKNHKESINAAHKAIACDSSNMKHLLTLYFTLTDAYIGSGNKDSASVFFHKYCDLKEKYITKEYQESIADMEIKYETEKKEIYIVALKAKQKLYMGLGISVVVALLSGMGLLFYRHRSAVQKQKFAEQQIKQLEQEKELIAVRSALDAEKAEQEVIARDLHDGVGAMLSVVKNNMNIMKSYLAKEDKITDYFNKAMDGLDKSITELRRVAHHIMPSILIEKGLPAALDDFCRFIPEAEFHCTESEYRFDSEKELILYRCAYELVSNALRHAKASRIEVHLNIDEETVYLSVVDNGCGFDSQTVAQGMGIKNLRTRLAAFNGRIEFYSEKGKGTEANVELKI